MKPIKKVMFHINSLGKGGAERVVTTLACEMVKKNIEVVVTTQWQADDEYELADGARRLDVGLTKEEELLDGKVQRRIRKDRLHEAIKAEKPDVIYSFCRNANYRAILAARGTGVPVIFSVRSDPKTDYASIKQKLLGNILYGMSAGGVFQTSDARRFFSKSVQNKSEVIINPLNEKYLGINKSSTRRNAVVCVGRFHEAKDHMTLIRAMEVVLKKHPEFVLEMYGDRSEDNTYDAVKKYVEEKALADKILFKGNSNELEKRIIDASVFVMSSKYEGMPNALMEAMAMSLPVVSTDCPCGGPAALIEDGVNGLLVRVGNAKEMAGAICNLIENREAAERLADRAGELASIATPSLITDKWLEYAAKRI